VFFSPSNCLSVHGNVFQSMEMFVSLLECLSDHWSGCQFVGVFVSPAECLSNSFLFILKVKKGEPYTYLRRTYRNRYHTSSLTARLTKTRRTVLTAPRTLIKCYEEEAELYSQNTAGMANCCEEGVGQYLQLTEVANSESAEACVTISLALSLN